MKKPFKEGMYLNTWGMAWVAIRIGKMPEKIRAMYKVKNGILRRKITPANAKKWNKLFNSLTSK